MRRINPALPGLLLSALLCGPAPAAAAGDVLPPNVTLGELEAAQARNLILEQKVQTARLEQQLRESQSGQGSDRNYLSTASQPAMPVIAQPAPSQQTASAARRSAPAAFACRKFTGGVISYARALSCLTAGSRRW